ncbi:MAG: T9SS type A sorting domain-containing protein, partial [Candidatus Glassbacteria bacterium]|nr:T9SS type A sorting domain-containing protein [Candidatus Glassbacteria bacterium]
IISNFYPAGRRSLRRLFGERDFYVAANQLVNPFSPVSSTQHLIARKLPQIFEPPYTVVSVVADFASNTAPPEGAQVIWPELILALPDPSNPARPWLENPLAVVRNFAGDGTLLSTDPLPFEYPVRVEEDGELWVAVRSPDNRFNAFHNIDVLGVGQGELQVDESFISQNGGASFSSVMNFGISWRLGVVVQGEGEHVPLADPVLVQSDREPGGDRIMLHFNRVRTLGGELVDHSPRISLRHIYNAPARQEGSVLRNVVRDNETGKFSFSLFRITAAGDSAAWRISGFGLNGRGDSLSGTVTALTPGADDLGGWLMLSRISGFSVGALDGIYRGRFERSANVTLDLVEVSGAIAGALAWPPVSRRPPDRAVVFEGAPGDTVVTLGIPPAIPSGFELTATDSLGRLSTPLVLGLGYDPNEPNQRLKDAVPVFPAYGLPQARHSHNSIRGTIFATADEDDIDWFSFPVHAGDSVEIDVDAVSGRPFDPASSLDAYFELFDSTGARFRGADGREVINDDEDGLDPYYTFVSPRSATVYLRLLDANVAYGDRGGRTGANAFYELRINILPRLGDVIRDRVVRIDDVLAALDIAAGRARFDIQAIIAADINRDNRVTNADAGLIYNRAITDPFGTGGDGTLLAGSTGAPSFEEFLRQLNLQNDLAGLSTIDLPRAFELRQNYPNPFNPSTTITYSVPEGGREVRLEVFDIRGRLVRVLAGGVREAGTYSVEWEGDDEAGRAVSSGVYFSRLRWAGFSTVRKMVLVK